MARHSKEPEEVSKGVLVLIIITGLFLVVGLSALTTKIISRAGTKTSTTITGEVKTISANIEETIVDPVVEQKVSVKQDPEITAKMLEIAKQNVEKEVEYKDKKIKIVKAKVSDEEDGKVQDKGGDHVSEFEVVGAYKGIDVSHHNGTINWAAVKAAGYDFAIIKVGGRGYGSGAIYQDTQFKNNINGATANGIKVGVYFYSAALNEQEALEEAAWTCEQIKYYRITYPVVYDFEEFGVHRNAGTTGAQATANAKAFLDYVASKGYQPMMYANKSDITSRFNKGQLPYKFWLAHYTTNAPTNKSDYKGSYQMWQFTSAGSVPGVGGRVDLNIAYFGYSQDAASKHTEHDYIEEVKNSKVEPTCVKDGKVVKRCPCGETKEFVLPATGEHTWVKNDELSTDTEIVYQCSVCQKAKTEKIETNTNTTNTTNTTDTTNTTNTTNTTPPTNTTENTNTTNTTDTTNTTNISTDPGDNNTVPPETTNGDQTEGDGT